jgi:hypothetical protein
METGGAAVYSGEWNKFAAGQFSSLKRRAGTESAASPYDVITLEAERPREQSPSAWI